jgi:hypothetical protein
MVHHANIEHRIAWLAGLLDGEGCIYMGLSTRKHTAGFIDCKVGLEMTHKITVDYAATVMREIAPDPFRVKVRKKRKKREGGEYKKQQYTASASSQQGTLQLLTVLYPYMVTKQTEARLAIDYLRRATTVTKYRTSERDRAIATCVRRLKKDDLRARADAARLLDDANAL